VPGVTPRKFREALEAGRVQDLLLSPDVRPGDCLFVPPGMVHAAGNGVLLLEVQQSSDITYRVYDWDRVDQKGSRRELHIEKALQIIDFSALPQIYRAEPRENSLNLIVSCMHFEMAEARVTSELRVPANPTCAAGTVVAGAAVVGAGGEELSLRTGDSFIVPPALETRILRAGDDAVIVMTFLL